MNGHVNNMDSGRTLLGVWAHPDDEAYLSAGLMAAFRRRGDRVVVVTATRGERGTTDSVRWPPHLLALLRDRELRNSLAVLGVDELKILGYPDGGCMAYDGTAAVASCIADVRPDIIVTFGPDGMTGHPDHRAVSQWVTNAWRATGSPAALWYATVSDDSHRRWGWVNDRVGLWGDQPAPPSVAVEELAHHAELSEDLLDVKFRALRAHASQTETLVQMLGEETFRNWWRTESFRAADSIDLRSAADAVTCGGER